MNAIDERAADILPIDEKVLDLVSHYTGMKLGFLRSLKLGTAIVELVSRHFAEPAERADQWPKKTLEAAAVDFEKSAYCAMSRENVMSILTKHFMSVTEADIQKSKERCDSLIGELESELNRPESQSGGWHPIESAPKDGTRILAAPHKAVGSPGWFIAHWGSGHFGGMGGMPGQFKEGWLDGPFYAGPQPTHWMRLPSPPQEEQAREER